MLSVLMLIIVYLKGVYLSKETDNIVSFVSFFNRAQNDSLILYHIDINNQTKAPNKTEILISQRLSSLTKEVTSIATLSSLDQVYLVDSYFGHILVVQLQNNESGYFATLKTFQKGISPGQSKVAVDLLAENIYWTDIHFRWIAFKAADKPEVDTDGYKVLIEELSKPEGLAIDSFKRLIFWADNDDSPTIEKSDITGERRSVVVLIGILKVICLALETSEERLYWIDDGRQQIESVAYNGSGRMLIMPATGVRTISIFTPYIFMTMDPTSDSALLKMNRQAMGIKIQNTSEISQWDSSGIYTNKLCHTKKCHHYCDLISNTATCKCFEGYILHQDGVTCFGLAKYKRFIYVVNNLICSMDIMAITGVEQNKNCFTLGIKRIALVASDMASQQVYLATNEEGGKIYKYFLSNQNQPVLILDNLSEIGGLVFDQLESNIMWTDKQNGKIIKSAISNPQKVTVLSELQSPSNLILNTKSRMIYWINEGVNQIVSASITGENYKRLIVSESPRVLALDEEGKRLYWATENKVLYLKTDGGDSFEYTYVPSRGLQFMFFYRNFLIYATNVENVTTTVLQTRSLISSDAIGNLTISETAEIADFMIMDKSIQSREKDMCKINNGGCSHLCYSNTTDTKCFCQLGYVMSEHGKCQSEFSSNRCIMFTDSVSKTIYQYDLFEKRLNAVDLKFKSNPVDGMLVYDDNVLWIERGNRNIMSNKKPDLNLAVPENHDPVKLAINIQKREYYLISSNGTESQISVFYDHVEALETIYHYYGVIADMTVNSFTGEIFVLGRSGNKTHVILINRKEFLTREVLTFEGEYISAIAVDMETKILYWAESNTGTVFFLPPYSGQIQRQLYSDPEAFISDIAIDKNEIYCLIQNKLEIVSFDKVSGLRKSTVVHSPIFEGLDRFSIFHNVYCTEHIKNGSLDSSCERSVGSVCLVNCTAKFEMNIDSNLTCLSNGDWDFPTDEICVDKATECTIRSDNGDKSVDYIGVIVTLIICIIIVTAVVLGSWFWAKRREKRQKENIELTQTQRRHPCLEITDNEEMHELKEKMRKLIQEKNKLIQEKNELKQENAKIKRHLDDKSMRLTEYHSMYAEKVESETKVQKENEGLKTQIFILREKENTFKDEIQLLSAQSLNSADGTTVRIKTSKGTHNQEDYDYTEDTHSNRPPRIVQPPKLPQRNTCTDEIQLLSAQSLSSADGTTVRMKTSKGISNHEDYDYTEDTHSNRPPRILQPPKPPPRNELKVENVDDVNSFRIYPQNDGSNYACLPDKEGLSDEDIYEEEDDDEDLETLRPDLDK